MGRRKGSKAARATRKEKKNEASKNNQDQLTADVHESIVNIRNLVKNMFKSPMQNPIIRKIYSKSVEDTISEIEGTITVINCSNTKETPEIMNSYREFVHLLAAELHITELRTLIAAALEGNAVALDYLKNLDLSNKFHEKFFPKYFADLGNEDYSNCCKKLEILGVKALIKNKNLSKSVSLTSESCDEEFHRKFSKALQEASTVLLSKVKVERIYYYKDEIDKTVKKNEEEKALASNEQQSAACEGCKDMKFNNQTTGRRGRRRR